MIFERKTVHPSQRAADEFDAQHKQFEQQAADANADPDPDADPNPPADPPAEPAKQAKDDDLPVVGDEDEDLFDANDPVLSQFGKKTAPPSDPADPVTPKGGDPDPMAQLAAQIADIERRHEQERNDWKRERDSLTTKQPDNSQDSTVAALQEQIDTLETALKSSQQQNLDSDLDNLIDVEALMNSENLNREAAQELADRILKPMASKLRKSHQNAVETVKRQANESIDLTKSELTEQIKKIQDTQDRNQRRGVNREIFRAHKDFAGFKDSREFKEFQMRTPPGSRTTFGDELQAAYEEGDSDHVINVIQIFKDGRAKVDDIADVDLAAGAPQKTTGDQPANNQQLPQFSYNDLNDWRYQYQRGDITQSVYQKRMRAFEKAEAAGRVE